MDEMKHTPGPWTHRLDLDPPDSGVEGPRGGCVAFVQPHGNVNTVSRTGEDFNHADARLIAAAPELLEALEGLVRAVKVDVEIFEGQMHKESRLGLALAAIAKAKGEAR